MQRVDCYICICIYIYTHTQNFYIHREIEKTNVELHMVLFFETFN